MPQIYVKKSSKAFDDEDKIGLKLSGSRNSIPNGLGFIENDGKLRAWKGATGSAGTGTTQNSAGNAIDGPNSLTTKIGNVIRCNETVTRKSSTADPDSSNEGINISTIINAIL